MRGAAPSRRPQLANGVAAGIVAIALALAGAAVPSLARAQEGDVGLPVGTAVHPVTIEDLDGNPVNLAPYIGRRPALFEFWAGWCENCAALERRMRAAYERHGAQVDFVAVAVAVAQTKASVKRRIAQHPLPAALVLATDVTDRTRADKRAMVFSDLGQRLSAARTPKEAAQAIMGAADLLFGWDACLFGLCVPALLHWLRLDPKIAAGPVTLALTDILTLLSYRPCYVTEISEELHVAPKAIIDHLKILEAAGLVESYHDEQGRKYYEIANNVRIEVSISPLMFEVNVSRLEADPEDRKSLMERYDIDEETTKALRHMSDELQRLNRSAIELREAQKSVQGTISEVTGMCIELINRVAADQIEAEILYLLIRGPTSYEELTGKLNKGEGTAGRLVNDAELYKPRYTQTYFGVRNRLAAGDTVEFIGRGMSSHLLTISVMFVEGREHDGDRWQRQRQEGEERRGRTGGNIQTGEKAHMPASLSSRTTYRNYPWIHPSKPVLQSCDTIGTFRFAFLSY